MLDATSIINASNKKSDSEKEMLKQAFRQYHGFNGDFKTYVPVRINDEIVKKLKAAGCEYNKTIGFHSPYPLTDVLMAPIRFDDVAEYDATYKRWRFNASNCRIEIGKVCKVYLEDDEKDAEFVGDVGDRISVRVKIVDSAIIPCRSDFGDFCKLRFADKEGNQFLWFQRTYSEMTVRNFSKFHGKDGYFTIHGTIKDHDTVRGVMYNVLRNCSIVGYDGYELSKFFNNICSKENEVNGVKEKVA